MKTLKFMAVAAAATLLGSCTSELVPEEQPGNGDIIRVRATAESHSRAAESYCNNVLPMSFTVWANTTDGAPYIKDAGVIGTSNNDGVAYDFADGAFRYWPANTGLNFIAYRSDEGNFKENISMNVETKEGTKSLTGYAFDQYEIKDAVAEQLDLLYAVKNDATKAESTTVNLNFRHALSQVVYRMVVENPTIEVNVTGVEIGHLYNKGTFMLPTEGTDKNWVDADHNDENGIDRDETGVGIWGNYSGNQSYAITTDVTANSESGEVRITHTPDGHPTDGDWANVMTLMPQKQEAWTIGSNGLDGAYLKLTCVINNVLGDAKTEAFSGDAYIPVKIDWKQGVRYIYTFKFGNKGNGGFTDPDDPKPALPNIILTVTTDDFTTEDVENNESGKSTFKLNMNDGVNSWTATEPESITSYTFSETPVSPTAPEGKEFRGWSSTEGGEVVIEPGSTFTETVNAGETKNYYPVFVDNAVVFTVNFYEWYDDGNGNTGYKLSTKYQPLKITQPLGTQSYTYILENPLSMTPDNKPKCADMIYTWDEATRYNAAEFNGWATLNNFKKTNDTQYTISASEPVLNLYSVWTYHFGIQADYSVIGKNNRRYNSSGYYNQNPAMYENAEKGLKSIWNTDYAKDGYAIKGFSLSKDKEGHGIEGGADYYPIGTPIPVYPSETLLTVYPVFE